MKLPNVTRGPVELSDIDYSPRLSQETAAFAAVVRVRGEHVGDGACCAIRNDGCGGEHVWESRDPKAANVTRAAVEAYAKTLPPIKAYGTTLQPDADLVISEMIEAAITLREDKRRAKQGFTFRADVGQHRYYLRGPRDLDAARAQMGTDGAAATYVRLVP